ncbi:MAG: hypothetical protein ACTS85_03710, partial [Arsenophonus sp. NC-PG7-MAG3]
AVKVLRELSKIGNIHKYDPEHASLGVLRSPDIPSILVETGKRTLTKRFSVCRLITKYGRKISVEKMKTILHYAK